MALRDSKDLFKIAEEEFGFCMTVLDIGGGFPGETHSTWNPSTEIDDFDDNKNLDESNMGNLDDKSNTNEGLLEKNKDDNVDDYDENY
mgnify:CR=1 FL=1